MLKTASLAVCFVIAAYPQAPKAPIFITPEQLDMKSILPTPPANGSPAGKAELMEVHKLQADRSAALVAHVAADDSEEDIFIYTDVLGDKFRPENLPATALLSAHMHSDEGVIVNPAKAYFEKVRPFNFDATVKPVCKTKPDPKDYGYPSGHAATGYLEALTLAMIVPEKRDAILARADDYAHSRVVCGVHYPSDVFASKLTAYTMMGIIVNNPKFQKELAAAKAETRHLLGL